MPSVRTVVRTLIAGTLAIIGTGVAGVVLAGPAFAVPPASAAHSALPAQASGQGQDSPGPAQATLADDSSSGLTVSIDAVGPNRYATPGSTIVVNGTVTNHTGAPVDGVQVQLFTSGSQFTSRSQMEQYYTGQTQFYGNPVIGAMYQDGAVLHSNSTVSWSISFSVSGQGYSGFNVYPLVAQVTSPSTGDSSLGRTLLPYYPGSGAANGAPQKLDVSWIWPLEDNPQQGACPQDLATNDLAASFQDGGRLDALLSAGLRYAATSHLTWAVDPALLSDATVMSSQYKVGGDRLCTDTKGMPASQAASTWLSRLRTGTASEPVFLTGYADPDVSALSHAGLGTQIAESYRLGNSVANSDLGKSFGPGATIAWPDGGFADTGVLTTLAAQARISTAVVSSAEPLPGSATTYVPDNATAHLATGSHSQLNVLLADATISNLLGSATASSSASAQFAVSQEFLAETAMIVAEAPNSQRSLVVAPPSRWDPSQNEASTLLSLTSSPWLQPVALSSLTGKKTTTTAQVTLPASQAAPLELSKGYVASVESAAQATSDYSDLLYRPTTATLQQLAIAVAVTESAAWRGTGWVGGRQALASLNNFATAHEELVKVISSNKVLLAGTSGDTPVSVSNGLKDYVQVQVRVSVPPGSHITVKNLSLIVVPPGQIKTIGMQVHSPNLGSTLVQLQLLTKDGTPLPGATQSLSVETTRFGRTLLILIAAALVLLVLASLARWARRAVTRLRNGGGGHHVRGKSVKSGGAGDHGAAFSGAMTGTAMTSSASGAGSGAGGTG
jgi:hypothetical protein